MGCFFDSGGQSSVTQVDQSHKVRFTYDNSFALLFRWMPMQRVRWIIAIVFLPMLANSTLAQACLGPWYCGHVDKSGIVPDVVQLAPNMDLLHDRRYRQVIDTAYVVREPNGYAAWTLHQGFNYVTTTAEVDGWVNISPDEWIHASLLRDINQTVSTFTGVFLPEVELAHTMAWVLEDVIPSQDPGADAPELGEKIMRYTRVAILDTAVVSGFRWYKVGHQQWIHQFNVAKVLPVERPASVDTDIWVSIDLYEQVVIAYEGNTAIFATLISTGLPRWPTYEGTFHIFTRREREDMTWGEVGDDYYYLEEVPWTMFFDNGRALHGAYWHDGFGYRRSHGCVNMSITDAHWMYMWVADYMDSYESTERETGPAVYVYSSGRY